MPSQALRQVATRLIFLISGLGYAAWAPLVPYAKTRASLDEGALGLLLLCLGAGSMFTMPLAGALAARIGCRLVITISAVALCLTLPLLATASSFSSLAIVLLVFGAGVGAMDVSMNIQAIIVERDSGRVMMSGFHGLFSLGGMIGAAGVAALLSLGLTPLNAALCIVAVIILIFAVSFSGLLPFGSRSEGPAFAFPHGVVLFLGLLCFVVFMMEGAVLDWSAVFLTSFHGLGASLAGLGYAAFALTMTVGRLTGDRIVRRLGGPKVIAIGGICAAIGIGLTLVPLWPVALLGYALIGAGCSNIVPVLFSSVGRQTVMPENVAVPAITTLGYAGILLGPAAIGFIAHLSSLAVAFLVMALLLLAVAATSRKLRV